MRKLVSHLLLTLDGVAVFSTAVVGTIIKLRDEAWRGDDRAQAPGMPVRSLATEIHPPVREPVALQILDF